MYRGSSGKERNGAKVLKSLVRIHPSHFWSECGKPLASAYLHATDIKMKLGSKGLRRLARHYDRLVGPVAVQAARILRAAADANGGPLKALDVLLLRNVVLKKYPDLIDVFELPPGQKQCQENVTR